MLIQIIILLLVFLFIAVRKIGSLKLQIWHVMLFGAFAMLVTGSITPWHALHSINLDVIFFLFGMFIIGQALEESGYLAYVSYKLFKRAKSVDLLLLILLFSMGIAAAILMNDTLAIIGTPVVLLLARKQKINPTMLLLALAFAVTIGSVMSPIGNPQNLLIALHGNIPNPFVTFLKYLLLPTLINLGIAYVILKFYYPKEFHKKKLTHTSTLIHDTYLANLCKWSLGILLVLILVKIAFVAFHVAFDVRLTYIALAAAAPLVLFSRKRFTIIRHIDWSTLIFFAAMFIVMEAVWDTGFFQAIIHQLPINILTISMILLISVVLSQLISNVPLVALYLPMLVQAGAGTKELIALAAGSTIAGNLLILGAASNVIIIQNAEKKAKKTITFWEFAKIGLPLTVINCLVYWFFLTIF